MALVLAFAAWQFGGFAWGQGAGETIVVRKSGPGGSVHVKSGQVPGTTLAVPMSATASRFDGLRVDGDGRQAQISLTVAGAGRVRVFATQSPAQIVFEGDGLSFGAQFGSGDIGERSLVGDYRYGAVDAQRARLVLDLLQPASIAAIDRPNEQLLLVRLKALEAGQVASDVAIVDLSAKVALPAQSVAAPPAGVPAAEPVRRRVVLIDPGHGGRDPGAVTESGVFEKDIVLAIALRLQSMLAHGQAYDVKMTRHDDSAVSLDRRVVLSGLARADLFISLHADTFAGIPQAASVRGGSIYVMSERASNRAAAALAEKENEADARLGADAAGGGGDAAVTSILSDLTSRETQAFARDIQSGLVGNLRRVMKLARDPARSAAFKVLRQAGTPAVLIELGYMSNAEDIALLQSADWQSSVAASIVRAVDAYFTKSHSVLSLR